MVQLSSEALQIINLLVAFVIPMLVALATKRLAAGWVKMATLVVLSAFLAVLTEVADKGEFALSAAFLLWLTNIVVAIASHFGITSQIGLSGKQSKVAYLAPRIGIGKPVTAKDAA